MKGALLGIAIAIVVACGAAPKEMKWPDPRDNEITNLWTQIRGWRADAHMQLDPTPQDLLQWRRGTVPEAKRVCQKNHTVPSTCNEVCNLSDDICDNAERICDLADELGKGDEYAQDKCTSAKASCREAQQRCCECSATPASKGLEL